MEIAAPLEDQIVMTPRSKTARSTTITIERRSKTVTDNSKFHVAGGEHKGIVINKELAQGPVIDERPPPQASLEFRVFLVNAHTEKHVQEKRLLQYWFSPTTSDAGRTALAQEFFRSLVSPQEFPRDYVGFIKKVMKLLQHGFLGITMLDVTLMQLDSLEAPPTRPLEAVDRPAEVLEMIEAAYPNPVTEADLAECGGGTVRAQLAALQSRGLVQALDGQRFTRAHNAARVVTHVSPTIAGAKQPTIAVITARFAAKMAVDALMEDKETFVRYTTVGESNVYTLGNMGSHRVVCTKLPGSGSKREAATAAGNAITRLLGTFQQVDFVVLVGIAGGVPQYADYSRHVRLGDVVASYPGQDGVVYVSCEAHHDGEFDVKTYKPPNPVLQDIVAKIKLQGDEEWLRYLDEGLKSSSEQDFTRPPPETDKLFMHVGGRDVIQVEHPLSDAHPTNRPRLHLGPIASSPVVATDDALRTKFASLFGVMAMDSELDAAIQSVLGNRRDSFLVLKGISDYKDGASWREWQPFAALAAASVMKAVIAALDPHD